MSGNKHFIKKISIFFLAILLTGEIFWGKSNQDPAPTLTSNLDF
jgi:hypothetical protein